MRGIYLSFFEGYFNIFLFLPYFFSVSTLLKTLFEPWKNLISKKTVPGFSFNEWFGRFSFNFISRMIGFFMRFFMVLAFILIEGFFVLITPVLIILFFICSPLIYLLNKSTIKDEEKKLSLKKIFVAGHTLKQENLSKVEEWFEYIYNQNAKNKKWWSLENLLTVSPLARDWAVGYTPFLDQYVEELTSWSYQSKIRYAIGREKEIREIDQVLSKSEEANVLIVGEEGVGKHTIIDSFAKRIYGGKTNTLLNYKRVLKLNLELILTKFTDQKQRENFVQELFQEASLAKNVIIMIEELEKYVSVDVNHVDLTIPIERFAKSSSLQIIATSTPFQYEKYIYHNEKINQLFSKIDVVEISKEKALQILLSMIPSFEERYHLTIPFEVASEIINKSEFYITYIPFPEKSLDLLDEICSSVFQSKKPVVTIEDIDRVITQITHAPTRLDETTKKTLVNFEDVLSARIIGQTNAVKQLSSAIRRSYILLGKRRKPLASFLFMGPTGVGKTETAKVLADIFFHDEKHLLRFDMSLYQSKNDIPNLIGSTDSQNPGLLTKAIRDNPYAVLLLDEIEKAHKELLNIFLTILDEGYFTDGFGKKVDCKNLVIIATSNAASDFIFEQLKNKVEQPLDLVNYLIEKGHFSPEFLNRFDGVIAFQPLAQESLITIAKKMIERLSSNYQKSHKLSIFVSDESLRKIIDKGYHPEFGARDLERTILQEIQDSVDKRILAGQTKEDEIIKI